MTQGYNGAFTGEQIDEAIGKIQWKNLPAEDVRFADGENFQEKYDKGQLTGPQGAPGPAGLDGKSAYQSAVEHGYTGSEETFGEALSKVGQAACVVVAFSAAQWTAGNGECTLSVTLPDKAPAGSLVTCQAAALVGGTYRENVWAARETYATLSSQGGVVLHCAGTGGYAGKATVVVWRAE